MKKIFFAVVASGLLMFCLAGIASAAILSGPIINPENGHAYYLLDQNTWTASEAEAVSLGGHLATINDAAENNWVYSQFAAFDGQNRKLWIGLNDNAQENTFVWSSGDMASYRNWNSGEPNNWDNEDCVLILDYNALWNDELCVETASNSVVNGVVEVDELYNSTSTTTTNTATTTTSTVSLWNISADYSISNNPNGAWSYGRKWSITDSGFDLMTVQWGSGGWFLGNWGHGGPSIQEGPVMWAKNNSNGYPSVRWTCPKSEFYKISGSFYGADSRGIDNTVYVVINGTIQFSDQLKNDNETTNFSIPDINLNQGNFIDFTLTWNGGVYSEYGWTGVSGIIEANGTTACDTTPKISKPNKMKGRPGDVVTITGSGFCDNEGKVLISMNGVETECSIISWKDTEVKITVPWGVEPGKGKIFVENTGGLRQVKGNDFTYIKPKLEIKTLSSKIVKIGDEIIIKGGDFGALQGDGQVVAKGGSVSVKSWSNKSITVKLDSATGKKLELSVKTFYGTSNIKSAKVKP